MQIAHALAQVKARELCELSEEAIDYCFFK